MYVSLSFLLIMDMMYDEEMKKKKYNCIEH